MLSRMFPAGSPPTTAVGGKVSSVVRFVLLDSDKPGLDEAEDHG